MNRCNLGLQFQLAPLHLGYNPLTSAPRELGWLNALTSVDLSGNQLTSVPAELGRLTELTTLILSTNLLTSVPAELGGLAALQTLNLYGRAVQVETMKPMLNAPGTKRM